MEKKKKINYNICKGEIFTDVKKNQWIIGDVIDNGGFGEVYFVSSSKTPLTYSNAIKIEPHKNGPLFVEINFYIKNCKSKYIEDWKKKHNLQHLGVPKYITFGSHIYKDVKYRFLIMDLYKINLKTIFKANDNKFEKNTIYNLTLQIIDILEYIHNRNYIHHDIKTENILFNSYNQIYLVDFGLVCKPDKEYKPNPKKAHNGTLEYISRDGHLGISTKRGDLEMLLYNMIYWFLGFLPWANKKNKTLVQREKEKIFKNTEQFLNQYFNKTDYQPIYDLMDIVNKIPFNEIPYFEIKNILLENLHNINLQELCIK